jgi:hypothetical protein
MIRLEDSQFRKSLEIRQGCEISNRCTVNCYSTYRTGGVIPWWPFSALSKRRSNPAGLEWFRQRA